MTKVFESHFCGATATEQMVPLCAMLRDTGHILSGRGEREKENASENRKQGSLYFY